MTMIALTAAFLAGAGVTLGIVVYCALYAIVREAALLQAARPGAPPLPTDQRERLALYRSIGRALREAAEPIGPDQRRH